MTRRIRVEIVGRGHFWRKAVLIEWEHQFPERQLITEPNDFFLIEEEWLTDLQRVAGACFSKVIIAPEIPSRLSWLRRMFNDGEKRLKR